MSHSSLSKENDPELYNIHTYNISIKNRELYLHSYYEIEDESGVDFRSAITFEKNVRYLNSISIEPIIVHMHLPGGVWGDCMGIYDTIRSSQSKIIIVKIIIKFLIIELTIMKKTNTHFLTRLIDKRILC